MPRAETSHRPLRRLAGAATVILCLWATAQGAAGQPKQNSDYCDEAGANLLFVIDTTTSYDEKDRELLLRAVGEMFEILHHHR